MLSFACCLRAGCLHKATKYEKKHWRAGSAEIKNGWCLAGTEKNGGGRLPSTWALTLTRPKTGGWALTRECALTWYVICHKKECRTSNARPQGADYIYLFCAEQPASLVHILYLDSRSVVLLFRKGGIAYILGELSTRAIKTWQSCNGFCSAHKYKPVSPHTYMYMCTPVNSQLSYS